MSIDGTFSKSSTLSSSSFSNGNYFDRHANNNNPQQTKGSLRNGIRRSAGLLDESSSTLSERYTTTELRISQKNTLDSLTANKLRYSSLSILGRESELEILNQCLNRCNSDGTRELVFLKGMSGTGKSALAEHFIVHNSNYQQLPLIKGKFDLILRDEPLSGFLDAFESFFVHLGVSEEETESQNDDDDDDCSGFRKSLTETFDDSEISQLLSIIPSMQLIFNDSTTTNNNKTGYSFCGHNRSSDSEANNQQVKGSLRKLCRLLTKHFRPLVIVLDDMQWADKASFDLLEMLMTDRENQGILFIACYRSNEASAVEQFQTKMRETRLKGSNISEIEISNLPVERVNDVVATLLSIDDDKDYTMEMAHLCHKRTNGNIFFLLQFMNFLVEESLLEFNFVLFKWKWDIKRVESETAATPNVVEMVTGRLSKLPKEVLTLLQLASCIGSVFQERSIRLAWLHVDVSEKENSQPKRQESLQDVLASAAKANFIERSPMSTGWAWSHDAIQEAALSTLSYGVENLVKWRTGKVLLAHLTPEELNAEIFVVANLLAKYQPSPKEVTVMVSLYLQAAEKSTSLAAFHSALQYAQLGISHLPSNKWDVAFNLSLRLYSVAAEAAAVLGDIDDMLSYCRVILDEPKCSVMDRLRAYFVKLEYLQNNGESKAALELGLQILSSLGCDFPKSRIKQAYKTLGVIRKFRRDPPTLQELRRLSPMADEKKKEIIKVIFRLEACFYYTKEIMLYALASARTIEFVLEDGLCDYSGGAFFALGNILSVMHGDLKYMKVWCELSSLISDLVPKGYHESRVAFASSCGFCWYRPIHTLQNYLLIGYKAGMRVGDTESAMWNCCHFLYFEFMAGRSLGLIKERCQKYILHMKEVERSEAALVTASIWRLIVALIGTSEDCSIDIGTTTSMLTMDFSSDIDDFIETLRKQSSPIAPLFQRVIENMLLTYRRDYIRAADFSIERGNEFLGSLPNQPIGMWDFCLRGVSLYAAAQLTKKGRYRRHARKIRAVVEKWYKQGNINVGHHVALFAAEELALQGKLQSSRKRFESAILLASRGGYIHDAAIANERYAVFLRNFLSDDDGAKFHVDEAIRLYREWGAHAIVDRSWA